MRMTETHRMKCLSSRARRRPSSTVWNSVRPE